MIWSNEKKKREPNPGKVQWRLAGVVGSDYIDLKEEKKMKDRNKKKGKEPRSSMMITILQSSKVGMITIALLGDCGWRKTQNRGVFVREL